MSYFYNSRCSNNTTVKKVIYILLFLVLIPTLSSCSDNATYTITNATEIGITVYYTSTEIVDDSSENGGVNSVADTYSNIILIPPEGIDVIHVSAPGDFQIIFGGLIQEYQVQWYDHNESLVINSSDFYLEH